MHARSGSENKNRDDHFEFPDIKTRFQIALVSDSSGLTPDDSNGKSDKSLNNEETRSRGIDQKTIPTMVIELSAQGSLDATPSPLAATDAISAGEIENDKQWIAATNSEHEGKSRSNLSEKQKEIFKRLSKSGEVKLKIADDLVIAGLESVIQMTFQESVYEAHKARLDEFKLTLIRNRPNRYTLRIAENVSNGVKDLILENTSQIRIRPIKHPPQPASEK